MQKKPFLDIYRAYNIGKWEIAREAKVELNVVDCMLTHEPVARDDALKVLNVVSRLAGIRYSLKDVDVTLSESTS